MGKIVLTGKGRRWLLGGHPWIYVDDVAGGAGEPGELVPVDDPAGRPLGWGLFSSSSRIAVRMVTRSDEQPNRAFWAARMQRALELRALHGLLDPGGACRLLSGDADGFPGTVVDRYGRVAVMQLGSQGADRMRDFVLELLKEALPFPLEAVVDRSDTSVRRLESLEPRVELLEGSLPEELVVEEDGLAYGVDVLGGHKTGAYLDQRANRLRAAAWAEGRRVLDAFAYDGLFGLQAARRGAESVLCLEQNRAAGERLLANARRNGLEERVAVERVDCMGELRRRAGEGERYGLVVVDPPAFARNRRELAGAERGYVELNRRGLALCEDQGLLVSASCSYNVRAHEFVDFLAKASASIGREARLEELAGAAPDHPHLLHLPETHYLKCAFVRAGAAGAEAAL